MFRDILSSAGPGPGSGRRFYDGTPIAWTDAGGPMSARRVVGVLSVVGAVLGVGTSRVVGSLVAPPAAISRPAEGPTARASVVSRTVDAYLDGILGRNLFDASRIGLTERPPTAEGSLSLLGTIVTSPVALSSALIADATVPGLPVTCSLGHRVQDRLLVAIGYDEVELQREDGTIEVLRWVNPDEGAGVAPQPAEEGIRLTGEGRYAVPRSLLTGLDPGALAAMGRSQVHRGRGGEPDGYRLAGLRKGTLPERLGLQNGDVVHAVADRPLTSAAEAMAAFGALQGRDELCVDLTRRGARSRLCYTLEPD